MTRGDGEGAAFDDGPELGQHRTQAHFQGHQFDGQFMEQPLAVAVLAGLDVAAKNSLPGGGLG